MLLIHGIVSLPMCQNIYSRSLHSNFHSVFWTLYRIVALTYSLTVPHLGVTENGSSKHRRYDKLKHIYSEWKFQE